MVHTVGDSRVMQQLKEHFSTLEQQGAVDFISIIMIWNTVKTQKCSKNTDTARQPKEKLEQDIKCAIETNEI
jgi:hypothetical protein